VQQQAAAAAAAVGEEEGAEGAQQQQHDVLAVDDDDGGGDAGVESPMSTSPNLTTHQLVRETKAGSTCADKCLGTRTSTGLRQRCRRARSACSTLRCAWRVLGAAARGARCWSASCQPTIWSCATSFLRVVFEALLCCFLLDIA
jgi:hypothetical protein